MKSTLVFLCIYTLPSVAAFFHNKSQQPPVAFIRGRDYVQPCSNPAVTTGPSTAAENTEMRFAVQYQEEMNAIRESMNGKVVSYRGIMDNEVISASRTTIGNPRRIRESDLVFV